MVTLPDHTTQSGNTYKGNIDENIAKGTQFMFSAYLSANQTISTGTSTKVQYNTEAYDLENDFDKDTNYRYTPQRAGKYRFVINIAILSLDDGEYCRWFLRKNGNNIRQGFRYSSAANQNLFFTIVADAEANGSTDYFEFFVNHNDGTDTDLVSGVDNNRFSASWLGS